MDIILSDVEGTLTKGSSWRALGRYLSAYDKRWPYYLFILRWLPRFPFVKLGLVDRQKGMSAWMQGEINLLKGKTREEINEIAAWIVENEMWPKRRPDVIRGLLQRQSSGVKIALVSSAYQPFVEAFADRLGAEAIGSDLVYHQDALSGLSIPVNAYQQKAEKVRSRYKGCAIVAAYGDTASDIPMLKLSQEPIAVYPSRRLRDEAISQGWRILD
jgi:HAD superfamily phosphoserine phosphatase-like hydrolase